MDVNDIRRAAISAMRLGQIPDLNEQKPIDVFGRSEAKHYFDALERCGSPISSSFYAQHIASTLKVSLKEDRQLLIDYINDEQLSIDFLTTIYKYPEILKAKGLALLFAPVESRFLPNEHLVGSLTAKEATFIAVPDGTNLNSIEAYSYIAQTIKVIEPHVDAFSVDREIFELENKTITAIYMTKTNWILKREICQFYNAHQLALASKDEAGQCIQQFSKIFLRRLRDNTEPFVWKRQLRGNR